MAKDVEAIPTSPSCDLPLRTSSLSLLNQLISQPGAVATDEKRMEGVSLPLNAVINAGNRHQLYQRFYDMHFGASTNGRRFFAYESLEAGEAAKDITTSAMDALCLAQLGTAFNDDEFKAEARHQYSLSLTILKTKLATRYPEELDMGTMDDALRGLHALTACAWFNCIEISGLEWLQHIRAIFKIIHLYNGISIRPQTVLIYSSCWRHQAFLDALNQRTKFSLDETPVKANNTEFSNAFITDYASDVPGLLARSDQFQRESGNTYVSQYAVTRLLTDLETCITKLKQWHAQWVKSTARGIPYRTVSTKTFGDFQALCGNRTDIVPLAYDISHPNDQRDFTLFCLCVLNLDQAILSINQSFPLQCDLPPLHLQFRRARNDAGTAANDLCMLIPQSTRAENMTLAAINSLLPLHHASIYYEQQKASDRLMFCKQVSKALSNKYGVTMMFAE